jgi:hypothetical protein
VPPSCGGIKIACEQKKFFGDFFNTKCCYNELFHKFTHINICVSSKMASMAMLNIFSIA